MYSFSNRDLSLRRPVRRGPAQTRFGSTVDAFNLLLLAAKEGQNLARLARRLGCSPSFVSRCARRLLENGVWQDGRTVAEWLDEGPTHPAFWDDVAVAEGVLCRRTTEAGGFEWAPAGDWIRPYENSDTDSVGGAQWRLRPSSNRNPEPVGPEEDSAGRLSEEPGEFPPSRRGDSAGSSLPEQTSDASGTFDRTSNGRATVRNPVTVSDPASEQPHGAIGRSPLADPFQSPLASTYFAAMLLLAGLEAPHNVELLAKRVGCDPRFVARCAVRLLENGVWRHGRTFCEWRDEGAHHPYFWNDVAVAEGLLTRGRYGSGVFQWAPAGGWLKYSDAAEQAEYWAPAFTVEFVPAKPKDRIAAFFADAQWLG